MAGLISGMRLDIHDCHPTALRCDDIAAIRIDSISKLLYSKKYLSVSKTVYLSRPCAPYVKPLSGSN